MDKWQDKSQRYIAGKFGEEVAQEVRDIMEGVEEYLVGVADRLAQENSSAKLAIKTRYKTSLRQKLGITDKTNLTASDIQALVEQLAADPNEPDIEPGMADKIRTLVESMSKEKVKK